jgi:hypothetical protein
MSMQAPTPEHSSSISAVPAAPAMLMSLPASHRPSSASRGSTVDVAAQPLGWRFGRGIPVRKGFFERAAQVHRHDQVVAGAGRRSSSCSLRARPSTATASWGRAAAVIAVSADDGHAVTCRGAGPCRRAPGRNCRRRRSTARRPPRSADRPSRRCRSHSPSRRSSRRTRACARRSPRPVPRSRAAASPRPTDREWPRSRRPPPPPAPGRRGAPGQGGAEPRHHVGDVALVREARAAAQCVGQFDQRHGGLRHAHAPSPASRSRCRRRSTAGSGRAAPASAQCGRPCSVSACAAASSAGDSNSGRFCACTWARKV